jgi:hypothetical protein
MTKIIFGIIFGAFAFVGSIADIRNKQKLEIAMLICIAITAIVYIPFIS